MSNKMTAHWSKKLDPDWSIEDMMKQTKAFFHTLIAVNYNLSIECCHSKQNMQTTRVIGSVELH